MPEGDSIRRVATALAPLVGLRLEGVTTQGLIRDLYACGVDPRTPIALLDAEVIGSLYASARSLILASLASRLARDRLAVYSKTNRPCARCAAPISAYQLGDPPRWTWSCPRCQPRPPAMGV